MTAPCMDCGGRVTGTGSRRCWNCHMLVWTGNDWGVVERLTYGDRVDASRAEVYEAIEILTGRGYSAERIGELVGRSERSVCRIRARLRSGELVNR